MAGWLHGVFVVDWLFVFPLCGFSLSLFCNYSRACMLAGATECLHILAPTLRALTANGRQILTGRAWPQPRLNVLVVYT